MIRPSLDDLLVKVKQSPFSLSNYTVDIRLNDFLRSLGAYTHGNEADYNDVLADEPKRIFECVPLFQRDNDKWSEKMQVSFIENILMNYNTTLMFYELNHTDGMPLHMNCKIIDGLQRMTAIYRFLTGEIKAWGYTFQELKESRFIHKNIVTIKIQCYSFDSEIEAVEFYIALNENISHSETDIKKAKQYLAKLKSEVEAV